MSISSGGNPMQGDPLAGTNIVYDAEAGTVKVSNRMEITKDGKVTTPESKAEAQYNVNFKSGADLAAEKLTQSDVVVPEVKDSKAFSEEGIFRITSDDGMTEVVIHDRGRISQGAIEVQTTNPDTGEITKLVADENTVSISKRDADGGVMSSGPIEMTGNAFSENDFRYQPTAAPGMGN